MGRCVDQCRDCETVVLCDSTALPPATIAGTGASGTLPNGVTYSVTAPSAFPPGRQGDGAAWWGTALFPNPSVPLTRWTFNQPVTVDFSVAMVYSTGTAPGENTAQLPPGAVPLSLPSGYTYNQATGILRADSTLTGCTLNTPTRADSARFRVTGVSTFTLQYLGSRTLSTECRRFGTWEFGALDVSLGGQFARTVCRDCTGRSSAAQTPSSTGPRRTRRSGRLASASPRRPRRSRAATPPAPSCATPPRRTPSRFSTRPTGPAPTAGRSSPSPAPTPGIRQRGRCRTTPRTRRARSWAPAAT
ncbi:hypothetical protein ACR6C2_07700 [Streptomyces sp. INA 01156]